jgi:hypothetical protein
LDATEPVDPLLPKLLDDLNGALSLDRRQPIGSVRRGKRRAGLIVVFLQPVTTCQVPPGIRAHTLVATTWPLNVPQAWMSTEIEW